MIYVLSHSRGAFWHLDSTNFSKPFWHAETLSKIRKEYGRSDEEFIKAFLSRYTDTMPPSWMMFEVTSFGSLSSLYSNLTPGRDKRDIANYFGLQEKVFSSWLHSIVYLRNICAHHARLWNKEMQIQPNIPISPKNQFISETSFVCPITGKTLPLNNRTYIFLSMIIYLMNVINPNHAIQEKFNTLLDRYPNIDSGAMGFPNKWRNEPLWMK